LIIPSEYAFTLRSSITSYNSVMGFTIPYYRYSKQGASHIVCITIKNKISEIEDKDKKINSFIVLDSSGISRKDIAGEGKLKKFT